MQVSNFVLDAVNAVLDWDLPDESYPQAVNAQFCQLAGVDDDVDRTVH